MIMDEPARSIRRLPEFFHESKDHSRGWCPHCGKAPENDCIRLPCRVGLLEDLNGLFRAPARQGRACGGLACSGPTCTGNQCERCRVRRKDRDGRYFATIKVSPPFREQACPDSRRGHDRAPCSQNDPRTTTRQRPHWDQKESVPCRACGTRGRRRRPNRCHATQSCGRLELFHCRRRISQGKSGRGFRNREFA